MADFMENVLAINTISHEQRLFSKGLHVEFLKYACISCTCAERQNFNMHLPNKTTILKMKSAAFFFRTSLNTLYFNIYFENVGEAAHKCCSCFKILCI